MAKEGDTPRKPSERPILGQRKTGEENYGAHPVAPIASLSETSGINATTGTGQSVTSWTRDPADPLTIWIDGFLRLPRTVLVTGFALAPLASGLHPGLHGY
jgi:hypothetical protein